MSPLMLIAGLGSAAAAAAIMWWLVPPTPRLAGRVRPYANPSVSPGEDADRSSVAAVFGPIAARVIGGIGRRLDPAGDETLRLRLRHAGFAPDLGDGERLAAFRLRQIRVVAVSAVAAGVVASLVGLAVPGIVGLATVGAVAGWGRTRGRLDSMIEERRLRMRIEVYTVDQVLALRVRAGGGVVQAVGRLVARGRGPVVAELDEALRLHRSGLSAAEAFERIADVTAEPACARTYRLLAIADERGVDLAAGLLALAEDVRESRREAIKRSATRRRAAMLVPTIALLAPTLLLFVAAPLPFLLTGWR